MKEGTISRLRREIDRIDRQIVHLLGERARVVIKVGHEKASLKQELYTPSREKSLIEDLKRQNKGPFPTHAIRNVFREIVSACRSLEIPLRVAYLGPEGTFTQMAAVEHFGRSCRFVACETIGTVFKAVETGKAHFGVAAVENSTAGKVKTTVECLQNSPLKIVGEVTLRIAHHLISRSWRLQEVKEVHSHPQAFLQCSRWLRKNLPRAKKVFSKSTAEAASKARKHFSIAAIASEEAARLNHLKIIAKGIENNPDNRTRFLVLGKGE